jgi:hypothetical protein
MTDASKHPVYCRYFKKKREFPKTRILCLISHVFLRSAAPHRQTAQPQLRSPSAYFTFSPTTNAPESLSRSGTGRKTLAGRQLQSDPDSSQLCGFSASFGAEESLPGSLRAAEAVAECQP